MDSSTSDSSTSTKCTCESIESDCSSSESPTTSTNKEKKKLSLTSLGFSLRRGRSLQFKTKRTKKSSQVSPDASTSATTTKKSPKWPLKFNCAKREPKNVAPPLDPPTCCQCMCYRRTEEHHLGAGVVFDNEVDKVSEAEENQSLVPLDNMPGVWLLDEPNDPPANVVQQEPQPIIREVPISANSIYGQNRTAPLGNWDVRNWDVNWVQTIHEDCDEAARRQRAKEMEEGVAAPANFKSTRRVQLLCSDIDHAEDGTQTRRLQIVCPSDFSVESIRALLQDHVMLRSCPLKVVPECHTQIDFIHCLVPDLLSITNCSYYWGKMDRYEAERLLDGKQDGTFLLRDSAQEEFLFSVSFRKYDRSLHARIEQWNHSFSFDSHDPCVYTSDTICGLIEHYKDPSSCMFFEPVLTWPLHRKSVFSLQHLCRAVIASRMTYDNINKLQLPKVLKSYLKEYHYRQKVHVERFDDDVQ